MKYDSSMTQFHNNIVSAIKSMIYGDIDKVAELAAEGSPVPLRDYLREHHGRSCHGGNKFDCMSSAFLVKFDHRINNDGDTKLQLSWSQVTNFIRKYPSEFFNTPEAPEDHSAEEETSSPGIEVLDLDLRTYNALKRAGINTIADAETQMEQLENIIPKKIEAVRDSLAKYKGIPIPGTWVEENMLGDELTFDELTSMVGDIIIIDYSTESKACYKAVKVEEVFTTPDGSRCLRYFDGAKQRGIMSEVWFDKNQRSKPERAWRIKHQSDFPCDNCGYDDNGCCDYPDTPDDYCVCGDKQIPKKDEKTPSHSASEEISAPAQTETTAPTAKYAEAVQLNAQIMTSARAAQQNLYDMAMGFKKMRDEKLYKELGYDNFGDYCEGETGMHRKNVYNYISIVENLPADFVTSTLQIGKEKLYLLSTIDEEHRTEIIENTDLESTTVKELREQIEQLKQSEAETQSKLETSQRNYRDIHDENQKLRADRVTALTRADNAERNAEKLERQASVLSEQVTDLERQIKELENRPRDVAVDTDELNRRLTEASAKLQRQAAEQVAEERRDFADKLNRMEEERDRLESRIAELESGSTDSKAKDREIAELKQRIEHMSDGNVKSYVIRLTINEFTRLTDIVKSSDDSAVISAVKNARIIKI